MLTQLFNYGIYLSELGRVAESVAPLEHCIEIDKKYVNAYVGLGFSLTSSKCEPKFS